MKIVLITPCKCEARTCKGLLKLGVMDKISTALACAFLKIDACKHNICTAVFLISSRFSWSFSTRNRCKFFTHFSK